MHDVVGEDNPNIPVGVTVVQESLTGSNIVEKVKTMRVSAIPDTMEILSATTKALP